MQGTLIFVHGTGVREPDYSRSWTKFQRRAVEAGFDREQLVSCPWGPDLRKGVVDKELLKRAYPKHGLFSLGNAADDDAAWNLLTADPLFELRLAAISGDGVAAARPSILETLAERPVPLRGTGIRRRELDSAVRFVVSSEEFSTAWGLAADDGVYEALAARAIFAQLRFQHVADAPGTEPNVFRDEGLRNRLLSELGHGVRADLSTLHSGLPALKWFATRLGRPLRRWVTGLTVNFLADVFWHVRSAGIEVVLADAVDKAAAKGRVVVAAHSLGGIAAVDLITDPQRPKGRQIDLLVTFGSQSSVLYAMDAMRSLRLKGGAAISPGVATWLNLFDRNDFIAFSNEPLRGIAARAFQEEIRTGLPFPDSHGAYVDQKRFWDLLVKHWPI